MLAYPQAIPDDAIDLSPIDPGFTRDFDQTLGNAATSTDGFDSMFVDVMNGMATVPDLVSSLGPDLFDAGAAIPDLATPWEKSFSDSLSGAISSGDSDFKQYSVDLAGNSPPTGGGGGTPPSGGGPQCQGEQDFGISVPTPVTVAVSYSNPTAQTYHVSSKTLTQDIEGVFSVTDNIPATLTPQGAWVISVTLNKEAPEGTKGTYTIVNDAPNSPNVLCLQIVLQTGGGGGGRKGSGGGPRR